MKKLLVLSCVLLAAFNLAAQGNRSSAGLEVSYSPGVLENQTFSDAGTEYAFDNSFAAASIRAYADFTYAVLSVGYRAAVSDATVTLSSGGASVSQTGSFSLSQIEFRALGKYPLHLGSFALTPMAGVEYTSCLDGKVEGVSFNSTTKSDFSDFSLLGGLGAEFSVSGSMYIRPSFIVGYSLTSKRNASYYTGVTYVSSSGWEYEAALSIGFWL
jgi:hypothetical protein